MERGCSILVYLWMILDWEIQDYDGEGNVFGLSIEQVEIFVIMWVFVYMQLISFFCDVCRWSVFFQSVV